MTIGIFPGTFDPAHEGHIAFALAAGRGGGLDRVIFLPEHSPRGKTGVSPLPQRLSQIKQLVEKHPSLEVAALDSRQFTVAETLPELRRLFAGELTLLIGSDVAHTLHLWPNLGALLDEMKLAVGLRGEHTANEIEQLIVKLGAEYSIIQTPHRNVSSSQIRLQLAKAPGF